MPPRRNLRITVYRRGLNQGRGLPSCRATGPDARPSSSGEPRTVDERAMSAPWTRWLLWVAGLVALGLLLSTRDWARPHTPRQHDRRLARSHQRPVGARPPQAGSQLDPYMANWAQRPSGAVRRQPPWLRAFPLVRKRYRAENRREKHNSAECSSELCKHAAPLN